MSARKEEEKASPAVPSPPPPPPPRRGFGNALAGLSGGLIATLVLHPLDLVKIRLQVRDAGVVVAAGHRAEPSSMRGLFVHIVRTEGVRALYRGVSPNALGAALAWGSYFFGYEHLKTWLRHATAGSLGPREHMAAALLAGRAGSATLALTNPVWVVKTRMCLQSGEAATTGPYRSVSSGLYNLIRHEGIKGAYKGFVPGLFGTSHGVVQFTAYEDMKARLNAWHGQPTDATLSPGEYIFVAAASKIVAATVTYPYQVIRSRLQDPKHSATNPRARDIIANLWRTAGVTGFYKGLGPNLVRVTPATCITFVVYEYLSKALRSIPLLA